MAFVYLFGWLIISIVWMLNGMISMDTLYIGVSIIFGAGYLNSLRRE